MDENPYKSPTAPPPPLGKWGNLILEVGRVLLIMVVGVSATILAMALLFVLFVVLYGK